MIAGEGTAWVLTWGFGFLTGLGLAPVLLAIWPRWLKMTYRIQRWIDEDR